MCNQRLVVRPSPDEIARPWQATSAYYGSTARPWQNNLQMDIKIGIALYQCNYKAWASSWASKQASHCIKMDIKVGIKMDIKMGIALYSSWRCHGYGTGRPSAWWSTQGTMVKHRAAHQDEHRVMSILVSAKMSSGRQHCDGVGSTWPTAGRA